MKIKIKQLPVGQMMNFAYIIGVSGRRACAVVDPGWDAPDIVKAAGEEGWGIEKILLTHAHFDHANGVRPLALETGATVYVHKTESGEIPKGLNVSPTDDGEVIAIEGIEIKCLHTPGHTPGSQCFIAAGAIFTGDTLFVDGCGRVDLPGSDPKKMLSSLKRIALLDPAIVVYPGHDYGPAPTSTIGEQVKRNPYMGARSEGMFL